MEYTEVLKRAWHLVRSYRVLWVFGVILALTTGGGTGGGQSIIRERDFSPARQFRLEQIAPGAVSTLIAIGVGLACALVVLIIATTVARYVAETALIRMVADYEETGQKRNVRWGFRTGWSRAALRLFLIDLLTTLPVVLAFMLLFLLALAPVLLWGPLALWAATESTLVRLIATAATVGLGLLVLLVAIVVGVILSALVRFFRRVCVLEQVGVMESIRQGYAMVRRHLKDVVIMWLIMVGLGIGWTILMIPVVLLFMAVGAALGGLPALVVGALAGLAFGGAAPWVLGAAVGLPIFILALAAPLTFLGGLWEVFNSNVWTLTYRRLLALENPEVG